MSKVVIRVDKKIGVARHIYSDDLQDMDHKMGGPKGEVTRASHCEPDPENPGTWYVDMGPLGGPRVGGFTKRTDALEWEVGWINKHLLGRKL